MCVCLCVCESESSSPSFSFPSTLKVNSLNAVIDRPSHTHTLSLSHTHTHTHTHTHWQQDLRADYGGPRGSDWTLMWDLRNLQSTPHPSSSSSSLLSTFAPLFLPPSSSLPHLHYSSPHCNSLFFSPFLPFLLFRLLSFFFLSIVSIPSSLPLPTILLLSLNPCCTLFPSLYFFLFYPSSSPSLAFSLSPFSPSLPPCWYCTVILQHGGTDRERQIEQHRRGWKGKAQHSSLSYPPLPPPPSSSSSPAPRPPPPPPAHTLSSPLRFSVHLHASSVLLRTRKFVRLSISDHTSFSLSSVTLPSLASPPHRLPPLSYSPFVVPHSRLSLSSIFLVSLSSKSEARDAVQVLC